MPRNVITDSDDENERPKTAVRKTRATLAAAEASPMRRSTRIRQGSVNPDGSSPESVTGAHGAPPVTRVTRRRAAATAVAPQVLEVPRTLRPRKNSVSSNISEVTEIESVLGTPKKPSRRLVTIQSSPDTPKPRPRRSTRATSESKSPTPVAPTTRRTRATSIEPEPAVTKVSTLAQASNSVNTPTRRRRTLVSALPTEPSVIEDADEDEGEDKVDEKIDEVLEISDEKNQALVSSAKKSSRRSSSSNARKSPRNESRTDKSDIDLEVDKSIDKEKSPKKNKSVVDTAEESELLKTPRQTHEDGDSSGLDNEDGETLGKHVQKHASPIVVINKPVSLDKSEELGVQIESLLKKSSEELANSPGDKENQKVNISPEKVRKNLEFTIANVNIVRSKPVGFNLFENKPFKKYINSWLDERGLSKSRYETVSPKSTDAEDRAQSGQDSNSENKPKKNYGDSKDARETAETGKRNKKVDQSTGENETVGEFELSNGDNSSKSEFSLAVDEDNADKEQTSSFSGILSEGGEANVSSSKNSVAQMDQDSDSDEEFLGKTSPTKHNSSKNEGQDDRADSLPRIFLVNSKQVEDEIEKRRRASMEKKRADKPAELESKSKAEEEEEAEAMDTNENEEAESSKNSTAEALQIDLMSFEEPEALINEKNQSQKANNSKRKSLVDSDMDSDAVVNNLFQNISAEEWNKNKGRQSKGRASLGASKNESDSEDNLIAVNQAESEPESEYLSVLNKSVNKKKRRSDEIHVEEAEPQVRDEKTKKRKSLNKSTKSNTSAIGNETEVEKGEDNRKSMSKSQEGNSYEAETVPENTEGPGILITEGEKVTEAQPPESAKKTPKSNKKKSNKSPDVFEFPESESENETDEENTNSVNAKLKAAKKSGLEIPKTPLNKSYSLIAEVDSDSVQDNVSDSDGPDDEDSAKLGFLFTVQSSGDEDEDYDPDAAEDESNDTIDSDVAKELNLDGNDDVAYSDDNVAADECRDSESEHSDEEDNGSDIADFVVPDDEEESSEASEEEDEPASKTKFKRILDKLSSEDEQAEETEENHGEEAQSLDKAAEGKQRRKSIAKTPENKEPASKSPALSPKILEYSPESARKSLSSKKSRKEKTVGSEDAISPAVKDLKVFSGPVKALLDKTIDLCTPESSAAQTKKSGDSPVDKLRKNLVEELGPSTPDGSKAREGEQSKTLKSKTPTKRNEKSRQKTPESAGKNNRDSIQLIQDLGVTKTSLSDLNQTMLTPNSETPVTKFLRKERLNDSLPLLELKKKRTKSFDKQALSQMNEDKQEDEEPSENYERREVAEESDDEESGANEEAEENGDEINANGHRDDEEEDGTDQESGKDEENGVEVDENENDGEDDEEESSEEEEISVKIQVDETKQNSKARKSLTKEPEENRRQSQGMLNGKTAKEEETSAKKRRLSNSAIELTNSKKRGRLESSNTPQSVKKLTKKMKIIAQTKQSDSDSDSDEAPESLGFGEARTEALQAMKEVAESVKASKEAKKKKRRDQLERIRQEKETKAAKKATPQDESAKTSLKRLPDDILDNISDVHERPKKKRKLSKKEEPILPSRQMFSPGKTPDLLKIEDYSSPVSSTGGGTTHFSVINLEKVKKQPKKSLAAASFREQMLARNPRQPVSAFLMYKAKQKASGKAMLSRKRA